MKPSERERARWLRLREYYIRYHQPTFQIDAKPGTLIAYRESLSKWEFYTDNPPLCEIEVRTLAQFARGMTGDKHDGRESQLQLFDRPPETKPPKRTGKVANTTANKHLRQIQAILDGAGPQVRGHREALEILERVPYLKRLKEKKKQPRQVEREEISAIYEACDVARYPKLPLVHPGDWWKALLTMAYTTGCRRGVLFGLSADCVDLKRRLIRVPAEFDKCDSERIKPLHQVNVRLLMRIRTDRPELFPWPHSPRTWRKTFRKIQREAGLGNEIDEDVLISSPFYKLHDFKRACGQALEESGASDLVIDYMLDHGNPKTSRFYIPGLRGSIEAVPKMPLPEAMLKESA